MSELDLHFDIDISDSSRYRVWNVIYVTHSDAIRKKRSFGFWYSRSPFKCLVNRLKHHNYGVTTWRQCAADWGDVCRRSVIGCTHSINKALHLKQSMTSHTPVIRSITTLLTFHSYLSAHYTHWVHTTHTKCTLHTLNIKNTSYTFTFYLDPTIFFIFSYSFGSVHIYIPSHIFDLFIFYGSFHIILDHFIFLSFHILLVPFLSVCIYTRVHTHGCMFYASM
jgi:hypothetical protein